MIRPFLFAAPADVGLMFCAYNLRRIINLADKNLLKKFLKELLRIIFGKITLIRGIVRLFFGAMIFLYIPFSLKSHKL
jgi:hypothetical protein